MQDRKIENSSKSDVCTEPILHHVTENGVEFELIEFLNQREKANVGN